MEIELGKSLPGISGRDFLFAGHIKRGFSIILLTFYKSHSIIYGIEYYITGDE